MSRSGSKRVACAQAVAVGAHAVRAVEAEQLRRRRLVADVAVRAGVVGGEQDVFGLGVGIVVVRVGADRLLGLFDRDDQIPVGQAECLLDRLGQARPHSSASFFSRSMTISMLCLIALVEFRSSVSRTTWPSTRARTKPRLQHVGEEVLELALLAADDRGEDQEPRPRRAGRGCGR